MPQPTQAQVHVDAILTNLSVAYIQKAEHFIASQVFPTIPVNKQSDLYYTYVKGDWFRDEAQPRADGTQSAGTGYSLSTDSYACTVYAMHKDVGPQARANADDPIDLDRDATELVTQRLMVKQEREWTASYFVPGVWANDVTPSNLWDNYTSGTPIEDVELGRTTMLSTTGYMPNTMVLGYEVFVALKHHPEFRELIKYVRDDVVTAQIMAKYFELDRILIAKAIFNSAAEGATDSFSFIHGKHALLCYVEPSPGLMKPSAGYTFTWRGISQGLGTNIGITREMIPLTNGAERIEGQIAWDDKVVAADMGYFFESVVS